MDIGDVVFCLVQPNNQYYAHIIVDKETCRLRKETKYWIAGIKQHRNGHVFKEDIFGVLVRVQVQHGGRYYTRPYPRTLYAKVLQLLEHNNEMAAQKLCEPDWDEAEWEQGTA